jgi:putative tryptophan/tyrosine transport system substrate-binding protein
MIMRRRDTIMLLGALAALSSVARGQPLEPVVGFLGVESPNEWMSRLRAFREGLAQTGYFEGRNVAIEYRWAEGRLDRLPALAAELVQRHVSLIAVPGGTNGALAAKAATSTIPILFTTGGDPVSLGLVADLNRPGGNLTGVVNLNLELAPKRLQLLHEIVPAATSVALLVDPTNVNAEAIVREVRAAAIDLGLQLHVLHASSERDLVSVFTTLVQLHVGALLIGTEGFLVALSDELAALTIRHAIPTMFQFRQYVAAGGLISYGASADGNFRQVGVYAGRILKGELPETLPVEESKRFELVINLKTARMLGLTVPPALLASADELIE